MRRHARAWQSVVAQNSVWKRWLVPSTCCRLCGKRALAGTLALLSRTCAANYNSCRAAFAEALANERCHLAARRSGSAGCGAAIVFKVRRTCKWTSRCRACVCVCVFRVCACFDVPRAHCHVLNLLEARWRGRPRAPEPQTVRIPVAWLPQSLCVLRCYIFADSSVMYFCLDVVFAVLAIHCQYRS